MTTARPPESPERRRRRLELQLSNPNLGDAEAGVLADEMLAEEAERDAEGRRHAEAISASFVAMVTCGVPGCTDSLQPSTGLCGRHTLVLRILEAEHAGAEVLPDGNTVAAWIGELLAKRRASAGVW
jgi:hypothetical protein